jgi:nucleotide-binding universal stress UspA family protein
MGTFHRLLCPIDFSEISRRGLVHALAIARQQDCRITVLHVQSAFALAAEVEAGLYVSVLPSAQDAVVDFVAKTVHDEPHDIRMVSTTGDVVEAIIDQAGRESSDLIIMGTHGRSGISRVLLGSVTERVIREVRCPVMTIPAIAGTPANGEPELFDPILCPLDFSRSCRKALKLALSIREQADARLILLHVLPGPTFAGGTLPLPVVAEINADAAEWRREALAALEQGLPEDARSRGGHKALVQSGRPSETILRIAQEEHAGLIVMGVQSRGTIDRLLFGSTTREVIHAAQCPVLSIRADKNDPPWVFAADIARLRVGAR